MKPYGLTKPVRTELLACLRQRRDLTTKRLMARFNVGRTTIWKLDQALREVSHETTQIVHRRAPRTELELDALAEEFKCA